jgi:hypothetical protein
MRLMVLGCVFLALSSGARAQPLPPLPPPPPPVVRPRIVLPPPGPPPVYVPAPYYPAGPPVYAPRYVRPVNLYYARRARILRGIGIPLLSVGIPMAMAGGIVWIVGASCLHCSNEVSYTGIGLLAGGVSLFVPGAILLGIGNYYYWMARFTARADFGINVARDHGMASLRIRF